MKAAYVKRLGLWAPGFPNVAAWCSGKRDPSVIQPEAILLTGPMRRRASTLTRMAVEVLGQATKDLPVSVSTLRSVWGTATGENETAIALLRMMQSGEGKLSPTRFHNSVFNTPSGYASIATENRAPSTTLCGGSEIAASCLLEAFCRLQAGDDEILVVLSDEPEPEPFDLGPSLDPLALAFCLSRSADGALAELVDLRREPWPCAPPPERFAELYIAGALPLVEAVSSGQTGRVALEIASGADDRAVWSVEVRSA